MTLTPFIIYWYMYCPRKIIRCPSTTPSIVWEGPSHCFSKCIVPNAPSAFQTVHEMIVLNYMYMCVYRGQSQQSGVCWTADQQAEWSTLHLGHDSYHILFYLFTLAPAHFCLTVQNRGLKHHSFHFVCVCVLWKRLVFQLWTDRDKPVSPLLLGLLCSCYLAVVMFLLSCCCYVLVILLLLCFCYLAVVMFLLSWCCYVLVLDVVMFLLLLLLCFCYLDVVMFLLSCCCCFLVILMLCSCYLVILMLLCCCCCCVVVLLMLCSCYLVVLLLSCYLAVVLFLLSLLSGGCYVVLPRLLG